MKFSTATKGKLKHYVYALVDLQQPKTDPRRIFYVGRGQGDRCFEQGEPGVEILRYHLSVEESKNVEAAVIDTLGLENLRNEIRGHDVEHGRQTWSEVERRHGGKPARVEDFQEPYMLYFINKSYSPTMDEAAIYDCARQYWPRAREMKKPRYPKVLAVVGNVVVRAYIVEAWFPAGTTLSTRTISKADGKNLWEFVGRLSKRHPLIGRRLTKVGIRSRVIGEVTSTSPLAEAKDRYLTHGAKNRLSLN
jgi:hypothetical protein